MTIGRALSPRTGKLVDRDWYFAGSEADAVEKANAKAGQWELLCIRWDRTKRPHLELLRQPLPHERRWPSQLSPELRAELDAESLQKVRREGPIDADELSEPCAEFSLLKLIAVYEFDRRPELKQRDVQNSTISKDASLMRQGGGLESGVSIRNLRKSANEILCNLVTHDGSNDAMLVVEEMSSRFLGQKSDLLVRLYKTRGKAVYARMNRFLKQLGDHLRANGVFDALDNYAAFSTVGAGLTLQRHCRTTPDPGGGKAS